jgi:hypothetical protein
LNLLAAEFEDSSSSEADIADAEAEADSPDE